MLYRVLRVLVAERLKYSTNSKPDYVPQSTWAIHTGPARSPAGTEDSFLNPCAARNQECFDNSLSFIYHYPYSFCLCLFPYLFNRFLPNLRIKFYPVVIWHHCRGERYSDKAFNEAKRAVCMSRSLDALQ